MKYSTSSIQEPSELATQQKVQLPAGLVGFPNFNEAEVLYRPDQLPFMWLKSNGEDKVSFLVVEPAGLVNNYEIDITEADVAALELTSPADAMILNIVTVQGDKAKKLFINLVGPIVINRHTLKGRQVIIGNCHKYSARHTLFEEKN